MMILYSIIALVAVVLFYIMIRREDARLKKHLDQCFPDYEDLSDVESPHDHS